MNQETLINEIETSSKDITATIVFIRKHLKQRTGKNWSVTRGKGTSYAWLRIQSEPKRRIECCDMSEQDRKILAKVLGIDSVHSQGVSIPASSNHHKLYMAMAATGSDLGFKAERYWD